MIRLLSPRLRPLYTVAFVVTGLLIVDVTAVARRRAGRRCYCPCVPIQCWCVPRCCQPQSGMVAPAAVAPASIAPAAPSVAAISVPPSEPQPPMPPLEPSTSAPVGPPPGFAPLFNGTDLTGWHGMTTFDPRKLAEMSAEDRQKQLDEWNATIAPHWKAVDGVLVNDGKGAYLTTDGEFGDFELLIDYKTVPKADSGIYLRGDAAGADLGLPPSRAKFNIGADKGSGGLWNNSAGAPGKDPLGPGRQAVRRMEQVPHHAGRARVPASG